MHKRPCFPWGAIRLIFIPAEGQIHNFCFSSELRFLKKGTCGSFLLRVNVYFHWHDFKSFTNTAKLVEIARLLRIMSGNNSKISSCFIKISSFIASPSHFPPPKWGAKMNYAFAMPCTIPVVPNIEKKKTTLFKSIYESMSFFLWKYFSNILLRKVFVFYIF